MCVCLSVLTMLQGVHTVTFEVQCDVTEDNMDEWLQVYKMYMYMHARALQLHVQCSCLNLPPLVLKAGILSGARIM